MKRIQKDHREMETEMMHRRIIAVLITGLLVAGNAFAWGRKIEIPHPSRHAS
jgi:hypothetical protein